jgi:hypothetical protein
MHTVQRIPDVAPVLYGKFGLNVTEELMHDNTSPHYKTTLQQRSATTDHLHLNTFILILSPLLACTPCRISVMIF